MKRLQDTINKGNYTGICNVVFFFLLGGVYMRLGMKCAITTKCVWGGRGVKL